MDWTGNLHPSKRRKCFTFWCFCVIISYIVWFGTKYHMPSLKKNTICQLLLNFCTLLLYTYIENQKTFSTNFYHPKLAPWYQDHLIHHSSSNSLLFSLENTSSPFISCIVLQRYGIHLLSFRGVMKFEICWGIIGPEFCWWWT